MKFLLFVTKDTEGNPLYRQMKESEYIDKIKRMITDIKNLCPGVGGCSLPD